MCRSRRELAAALLSIAACSGAEQVPDAGTPAPADAARTDAARTDAAGTDASEPDAGPACCSAELCASLGSACNARSCRCELVPCTPGGEPCDPAPFPDARGALICAPMGSGSYCAVQTDGPEHCPPGIPWCSVQLRDGACTCGLGCRWFMDDCAEGIACLLQDAMSGGALGVCRGSGGREGVGQPCADTWQCVVGLACAHHPALGQVCQRPECGLAEGAPSCPAGTSCAPFGPLAQLGVCRTACDPFRRDGPCAPSEACLPARGTNRFFCTQIDGNALPSRGEPCDRWCRAGFACYGVTCADACDPAMDGPCSEGDHCAPPGICARTCDPFTPPPRCPDGSTCRVMPDATWRLSAHCLPAWPQALPKLDEPCWDACDDGLVCSSLDTCKPPCEGATHPCLAGEHCFPVTDRTTSPPRALGYGFCAPSSTSGGADCPSGRWCRPLELDPTSGRWIGTCI